MRSANHHPLPEDGYIPAFHAEEGDDLCIMGILVQDFVVGIHVGCVGQPGYSETVIGCVDVLGTLDGVLSKIIDGGEILSFVSPHLHTRKRLRGIGAEALPN